MKKITEQNTIHENNLIDLIKSGDSILMVGAGATTKIGYPLWPKLIDNLERYVLSNCEDENEIFTLRNNYEDDLKYCKRLKESLGKSKFETFMHETFCEKGCAEYHEKLVDLPFKSILTTNYDPTLSIALSKVEETHDPFIILDEEISSNKELYNFLQSLNYGNNLGKKIIHLHGRYNIPKSIILCSDDYNRKYSKLQNKDSDWPLFKRIMWTILATRRIIYIGFSFNDPFFKMMHYIVSSDFGQYNSETHYTIMGLYSDGKNHNEVQNKLLKAEQYKRQFGVQTVFFEDDANFSGLEKYINKLYNSIKIIDSKENIIQEEDIKLPENKEKMHDNNDALAKITLKLKNNINRIK